MGDKYEPIRQRQSFGKSSNPTKIKLKIKPSGAVIKPKINQYSPLTQPLNKTALEIHSNPVQLATRSLSSRSLASNSSQSINPPPPQSSSRSYSLPPSRRKSSAPSSRRKREEEAGKVSAKKSSQEDVSGSLTNKGFNIVDHLCESMGNEESTRSLSPDVHQLLQDISTVMHSVSPMSDAQSPPKPSPPAWGEGSIGGVSTKQRKRHPLRSKVAANFSLSGMDGKENRNHTGMQPRDLGGIASTDHIDESESKPKTSTSVPQPQPPPGGVPFLRLNGESKDHPKTSAAIKIQRWYRDKKNNPSTSLQESTAGRRQGDKVFSTRRNPLSEQEKRVEDVKTLLQNKRSDLNRSRLEELEHAQSEVEALERKKQEREKRRAAKMKADRMAAIEELHRRREEKRARQEVIAQEEIGLLQASGKVKKPQVKKSVHKTHKGKTDQDSSSRIGRRGEEEEEEKGERARDKLTSISRESEDKVVDDFFEAGSVKMSSTAAPIPISPSINHQATSTYDEIMATLRLLEEVPPSMDPPISDSNGRRKLNTRGSGGLSGGKLQSILTYLDQVEKAEVDRSNELANSQKGVKGSSLSNNLPRRKDRTKQKLEMEEVSAAANDVTSTILAQRMELDSKAKTVEMLQKALSQQRELTVYHARELEKEGKKRIELQKKEYESTIKRHQCFIDQLIDDKKVLSERCEKLVKELKELERKYKSKLASLEESHKVETNKLKQVSAAADKIRRGKWQADETHRIKEATVKGLEPEIQRIIAKGKAELQKQKALHEAELMQVDERASRRFVAQMEEMREQCAFEKEQACVHERELARQRYEKMAEQEELNYQQQRRRLFGEVAQEKEKMADQLQRQRISLDLQLKENTRMNDRLVGELKVSHQQQLEELQLKHRSEAHSMDERLVAERQIWEENLTKKQEADMMTKERELRRTLREERDKEIEMVISRLEEETASSKEETERVAEARVRRIREKYEAELREVERSERSTMEKFNSMKSQLMELKGEVTCLQSMLHQKHQEVIKVGEVASKLTQERDNVSDVVRQEFADRLVSTEEENKELKIEMSELRARHKVELERVNRAKARELEEVHGRVKQALEKKEENLTALKEQYEGALKRADHLQMLLQRQRTELLKK